MTVTTRAELRRGVDQQLGRRRLVWAGIRGDDIEPLTDLPQLDASFSIIGRFSRRTSIRGIAYEDLSGVRVDLETWDIDDHLRSAETGEFRRAILAALTGRSALLPYRPSQFLSAITFARRDDCLNLGLFGAHQNAFEHKPWVESSLRAAGVETIPWTYIADEEQLRTRRLLNDGPVLLRRSRTSGGEGIVRVNSQAELLTQWPHLEEAFVSVAPYLEGGLPINVGGVVWSDAVTVHHPSVQLVGIPSCVSRPFGYCGNDFVLIKQVGAEVLDAIEEATQRIGRWLRSFGYLGTFGVDFLLHRDRLLFTEVNPRFQGSTHLSSQLAIEAGLPCLMLEHLAASLGVPAPQRPRLRDLTAEASDLSHVVIHRTDERPAERLDPAPMIETLGRTTHFVRADVVTRSSLVTAHGAAVARITYGRSITRTGFDLALDIERGVRSLGTSPARPAELHQGRL